MKYFIKKFWIIILIAACINIPLLVLGATRTNKTVTLKGDTTIVDDFVEIKNPYRAEGSLSTIYVISLDHSTILQNLMVSASSTSELSELPSHYLHFTDAELTQMARIQHESSIMYSLILSYKAASLVDENIHLGYEYDAYVIAYYDKVSEFRIGDRILGVNGVYAHDSFDAFAEEFNNAKEGTVYQVKRGNEELEITYTKDNMRIAGYSYYTLDSTNASPQYKIKNTNVGGPSGGLLQTLALYNSLIEEDITKGHRIAGTGTIEVDGTVGMIGGIQQKIYTAYDDAMEIFLCPEGNYEEALIAYNKLPHKERMKLYSIKTFEEALEVLKNA
ncbi:MAG: hypothetical protein NC310_06630 [Roseburia sp.]|nr:hypothetical protein [Anaeroplasma bactoclasticum]MCM1196724.1 hypothetical protein [Roseburia sp.]MCM1557014.1 hypothetical protein [Anaeroplasma bactoclasticum]